MIEVNGHRILTSLEEKVAPENAAIVIVDMQRDFTAPGGFSDRLGIDIRPMERVARELADFLEIARGYGVLVIHAHSNYDEAYMSAPMHERLHRLGLEQYCQTGTTGILPHPLLLPHSNDLVAVKHRFDAFFDTRLEIALRAADIKTVILTGTTTAGCVDSTARSAYFRDFYVVVVEDLVCGASDAAHAVTMDTMRKLFGVTASARDIIDSWEESLAKHPARAASGDLP